MSRDELVNAIRQVVGTHVNDSAEDMSEDDILFYVIQMAKEAYCYEELKKVLMTRLEVESQKITAI